MYIVLKVLLQEMVLVWRIVLLMEMALMREMGFWTKNSCQLENMRQWL